MPVRNVRVAEHLNAFIEQGVLSGRFADADRAVEEALSLLQRREAEDHAKLVWLRAATQEGLNQIDLGEGLQFDSMDDLAAYIHQIDEELAAREPTQ